MMDWINNNSPANLDTLLSIFDNTIRSRIVAIADDIPDNKLINFHTKEDDLIELSSG